MTPFGRLLLPLLLLTCSPDKKEACPRCNSMDTKFCYYNNYNIKQPRFYCKASNERYSLRTLSGCPHCVAQGPYPSI